MSEHNDLFGEFPESVCTSACAQTSHLYIAYSNHQHWSPRNQHRSWQAEHNYALTSLSFCHLQQLARAVSINAVWSVQVGEWHWIDYVLIRALYQRQPEHALGHIAQTKL
jgi:hypothetical protein